MQESLVGHDCPEQTWSRSFVRLRDRRFSLSFPSTALIATMFQLLPPHRWDTLRIFSSKKSAQNGVSLYMKSSWIDEGSNQWMKTG